MNTKLPIGRRVKNAREALGETQVVFAERLACTPMYVSMLETAQRDSVSPQTLRLIELAEHAADRKKARRTFKS